MRGVVNGDSRVAVGVSIGQRVTKGDPPDPSKEPVMSETPDNDQPRFAEVVHTDEALNELFEKKDHNWRYAGFVSVLVMRRAALQPRLRDHLFAYAKPTGERARTGREVAQFVMDALRDHGQIAQQMTDFMCSPAFVAVVCSPHDEATADAEPVYQAAMRMMDFYERFLTMSERSRGLAAPSEHGDLLNNCARLSDMGIDGFNSFIDRFVDRVAEMPAIILNAGGGEVEGEPIVLEIKTDQELLDTIVDQLQKIAENDDDAA